MKGILGAAGIIGGLGGTYSGIKNAIEAIADIREDKLKKNFVASYKRVRDLKHNGTSYNIKGPVDTLLEYMRYMYEKKNFETNYARAKTIVCRGFFDKGAGRLSTDIDSILFEEVFNEAYKQYCISIKTDYNGMSSERSDALFDSWEAGEEEVSAHKQLKQALKVDVRNENKGYTEIDTDNTAKMDAFISLLSGKFHYQTDEIIALVDQLSREIKSELIKERREERLKKEN